MHRSVVHSLRSLTRRSTAAAIALALTIGTASQAGVVRYYADGEVPDPAVVAGILGKGKPVQRMKMRGGSDYDEPAAAATDGGTVYRDDVLARERQLSAAAESAVQHWQARLAGRASDASAPAAPAPSAAKATALAVAVNFGNDSARLPADALPTLDAVAEGMRQVGFVRPFVIEGHTSATGSSAHNLVLSRQRAESVKRYLVQRQQLPPKALRTVGLGQRVPLASTNPGAAANRRVQFRTG